MNTRKFDREEIAWAAGLFEGEGCVRNSSQTKKSGTRTYACMTIVMTDKDVLEKFQRAVGGMGAIHARSPQRETNKPLWYWYLSSFEKVQAVCAMLWPWLGTRRQEQITQTLTRDTTKGAGEAYRTRGDRLTHCPYGHLYTVDNSFMHGGKRWCRTCRNEAGKRFRRKKVLEKFEGRELEFKHPDEHRLYWEAWLEKHRQEEG